MLCLELGQRISRLLLEQPKAGIMTGVLQCPSGCSGYSWWKQTDPNLRFWCRNAIQSCGNKDHSSSLHSALFATITSLPHMYAHETEVYFKTQVSKTLFMIWLALTFSYPALAKLKYNSVSKNFCVKGISIAKKSFPFTFLKPGY